MARWHPPSGRAGVVLLLLHLTPALAGAPYSCKMDSNPLLNRPVHDFNANKDFLVGIKGSSAVMVLQESKEPDEEGAKYNIIMSDGTMAIQRLGVGVGEERPRLESAAMPASLLDDLSFRYFWVRAAAAGSQGEVSLGRAGEERALITLRDADFKLPKAIQLPVGSLFLHSCSDVPVNPPLGCRKHSMSHRYEFSESFGVDDEQVVLADNRKAIRFLVKSSRDTYVRLRGSGSSYFEIDLNFVNKLAIQRGAVYLNSTMCFNCLSVKEFRLFTIVYDENRLELHEGAGVDAPSVSVAVQNFKISSISFASMSSAGVVHWIHACQGLERALQAPAPPPSQPTNRPPPQLPSAVSPELREVALNSPSLVGCRMVHTFKYSFDGYFALSEEGTVSGATTTLPFRVLGRKDVHLQLVSSIPPTGDDYYEIDIDFYNHTNVDRGRTQQKVATVQQSNMLSATEVRSFVIVHDAQSGVLNITWMDGRGGGVPRSVPIIIWRDPKPFALRYFSICSGSSAGNDTTWMFGCPGHYGQGREDADRNKTGCSRPLLTYKYSHSQYLSLQREGTVNGSVRTINLFLRAQGSGHIRLEHALPPAMDALFEVDVSHEGNTSIDYLGKQMASARTPGLLSDAELRGFWVRQDVEARRLEVGRQGDATPIVSWTAPATATKFAEIRLFSLATSRSVGNGTWFYGCKDGYKPEQTELVADPEQPSAGDDTVDMDFGSSDEDAEAPSPSVPRLPSIFNHHVLTASTALKLHFRLIDQPPAEGTAIGVRFTVSKVYLDDVHGAVVVRGHLLATWLDPNIRWEPKEFDDIKVVSNADLGWSWVPELTVFNGELDLGGVTFLHHSGVVRWEASLHAQAHCALDARRWPHDRHDCELKLGLASAEGRTLHLLEDHEYPAKAKSASNATDREWVTASAAGPLWLLQAMSVAAAEGPDSPAASNVTLQMRASLRRRSPVLHHVLLAPFVVLSALCLLAYWVRDPLPRDKVALGCAAMLLLVLAFLVLEAACPPGLVGMPAIVEVYCWCVCVLALSVATSAIMTALAREEPVRSPPAFCCSLVANPFLRCILLLNVDQVYQRVAEDELRPHTDDYKKGSAQVYTRFDEDSECACKSKACSKQVAMEARYYWTLLALACERTLSIICFVLLLVAVVLVK